MCFSVSIVAKFSKNSNYTRLVLYSVVCAYFLRSRAATHFILVIAIDKMWNNRAQKPLFSVHVVYGERWHQWGEKRSNIFLLVFLRLPSCCCDTRNNWWQVSSFVTINLILFCWLITMHAPPLSKCSACKLYRIPLKQSISRFFSGVTKTNSQNII